MYNRARMIRSGSDDRRFGSWSVVASLLASTALMASPTARSARAQTYSSEEAMYQTMLAMAFIITRSVTREKRCWGTVLLRRALHAVA